MGRARLVETGRAKDAAQSSRLRQVLGASKQRAEARQSSKVPWTRKVGARPIWWQKPRVETDRPPHEPGSRCV
eukprot:351002-Chlamydomonas_euryale.AAC.25